jgi:hypothetical protein
MERSKLLYSGKDGARTDSDSEVDKRRHVVFRFVCFSSVKQPE